MNNLIKGNKKLINSTLNLVIVNGIEVSLEIYSTIFKNLNFESEDLVENNVTIYQFKYKKIHRINHNLGKMKLVYLRKIINHYCGIDTLWEKNQDLWFVIDYLEFNVHNSSILCKTLFNLYSIVACKSNTVYAWNKERYMMIFKNLDMNNCDIEWYSKAAFLLIDFYNGNLKFMLNELKEYPLPIKAALNVLHHKY